MSSHLLDLTRPLSAGLPVWPGDRAFAREVREIPYGERTARASALSLSAHAGTHVDAPSHLPPGEPGAVSRTVDELPLEVLVGPARVVDARGHSVIGPELIHRLEGCPPRVLLRTDNSERPYRLEGFVALTGEAADALVSRACLLVGIDGPSVDPLESEDLPAHVRLLDAGVVIIEGLDLGRAEPGDYELLCLPLALAGADGAPARVLLRSTR